MMPGARNSSLNPRGPRIRCPPGRSPRLGCSRHGSPRHPPSRDGRPARPRGRRGAAADHSAEPGPGHRQPRRPAPVLQSPASIGNRALRSSDTWPRKSERRRGPPSRSMPMRNLWRRATGLRRPAALAPPAETSHRQSTHKEERGGRRLRYASARDLSDLHSAISNETGRWRKRVWTAEGRAVEPTDRRVRHAIRRSERRIAGDAGRQERISVESATPPKKNAESAL